MTDDIMKRTREWLQSCVNAATRSGVPEEADLEAFILAHIDGEPARLAAAREEAIMAWRAGAADRDELRADCERRIAAAREEQREACALDAEERVGCASTYDEIRSVPLDATPLADELRTLRARVAELEAALLDSCREKVLHGHTTTLLTNSLRLKVPGVENYESWGEERRSRLQQAEAQVAAARAECARIHDVYPMEDAYAAATDVLRAMDEATKK